MRQLCKGNVAIVKGAVLAGCKAFYGYPITPASEIAEYAALLIPEVGGTFLQAESEVAAINMVYGASSAGQRVMTASSGPGLSLMQEGISYMAGAELPGVIVDVVRGGPGLGNIAPEQSDYFCVVKGGGHGCYRNIVLGAGIGAGDVRPHRAGVRVGRSLPQSRSHHDRRLRRPDDGAARNQDARHRAAGKRLGGEGHGGVQEKHDQLHRAGAGCAGSARPQAGSEVSACAGAGEPSRELSDRRCRDSAGRLWHRVAGAALGRRSTARPGHEGRTCSVPSRCGRSRRASCARRPST